eukprot:182705-Chlamydomonas_euryale.AAC.2
MRQQLNVRANWLLSPFPNLHPQPPTHVCSCVLHTNLTHSLNPRSSQVAESDARAAVAAQRDAIARMREKEAAISAERERLAEAARTARTTLRDVTNEHLAHPIAMLEQQLAASVSLDDDGVEDLRGDLQVRRWI